MEELFNVAGEEFYFDLDKISEFIKLEKQENLEDLLKEVQSEEVEDTDGNAVIPEESYGQIIDITKWELTKAMIEVVLSEQGELDESMGLAKLESQLSIPFRISFNTLLINKILKKNG